MEPIITNKTNEHFNALKFGYYWGFLDETGKIIHEPEFEKVDIQGEIAFVYQDKKIGVINPKMEIVIPIIYSQILKEKDCYKAIDSDGKVMIYTSDFKPLIKEVHDDIKWCEKFVAYRDGNNITIFDLEFNKVLTTVKGNCIVYSGKIRGYIGEYIYFAILNKNECIFIMVDDFKVQPICIELFQKNNVVSDINFKIIYMGEYCINTSWVSICNQNYYFDDSQGYLRFRELIPNRMTVSVTFDNEGNMVATDEKKKRYFMTKDFVVVKKGSERKIRRYLKKNKVSDLYNAYF